MSEPPAPPETAPPLDLEAVRARADAAWSGPWVFAPRLGIVAPYRSPGLVFCRQPDVTIESENAEFIARAREDVPALIAEVEHQRFLLERLRAWLPLEPGCQDDGESEEEFTCPLCGERVKVPRPYERQPHAAGCPWPELEAAVLSWRR